MSIRNPSLIAIAGLALGAGCGRGLDSRPTPAAPDADAAVADATDAADGGAGGGAGGDGAGASIDINPLDRPGSANDGRDSAPGPTTIVPVYPPDAAVAPGSSCGVLGAGGVRALAVARDRPVVVVGHTSGRVVVHSSDDGLMIGPASQHLGPVTAVAVSVDGTLVASGSSAGDMIVAAPGGGRAPRTIEHSGPVNGLAFSPDAAVLASSAAGTVRAWRVSDGATIWSRPVEGQEGRLAFSADGQTLIGGNRAVIFRRASDGAVTRELALRDRPLVTDVSADGSLFAGVTIHVPGITPLVGLWRASDGEPVWMRSLGVSSDGSRAVLSPDRSTVTAATPAGIQLFRAVDGSAAGSFAAAGASALAFAPGGASVVVGDEEGGVRTLAVPGGEVRAAVPARPGHVSPIAQVAFSPDGRLFASSSYGQNGSSEGQSLKLWQVSDGRLLFTLPEAGGQGSQRFAFSPDSSLLAVLHRDGRLHLVRTSDGQETRAFGEGMRLVAFAPDGQTVLTACDCPSDRRPLRRWRVADGGEELGLGDRSQAPRAFAFSPDGTVLAMVSRSNSEGHVGLWQVSDNARLWQVARDADPSFYLTTGSVVFSPDGTLVAYSTFLVDEADVRVHRRSDGTLVQRLQPKAAVHPGSVLGGAISFSRDGAWLAAGADGDGGGGLTLYRTATWAAQPPMPGSYLGVAFSPTEDRLLGGGRDQVLRMFCDATAMVR